MRAVAEGRVPGGAALEVDLERIRVLALVVDPGARERGVGRRLIDAVEELATSRGAAFLEVTSGHHRPDATRLFEALGYEPNPTSYLRKRL